MLVNALFPTRDIGTDPAKIRDWAQAVEGMGYPHIEVADHVFGAAPRGNWKPSTASTIRSTRPSRRWPSSPPSPGRSSCAAAC